MAAGLVDRVQVPVFPVISGRTGTHRSSGALADFDLELIDAPHADGQHPGAHLPPDPPRRGRTAWIGLTGIPQKDMTTTTLATRR